MRVVIRVGRQFDDEHVWVVTVDAVMSWLASEAFLVMIQRHSSARHPESCQQFVVCAVRWRRCAGYYQHADQHCQRYKTRQPARENKNYYKVQATM
jgi:hypothetical protein